MKEQIKESTEKLLLLKNIEILRELGYLYEEKLNSFWAIDNELYVNLPIKYCNDLVRAMKVIIEFEKELSYYDGKLSVQYKSTNTTKP